MSAAPVPPASRWSRVVRPLGLVVGLALAIHVLREADLARVLAIARAGGAWLPVIALLQVAIVACDGFALERLVRDAPFRAPLSIWCRACAVANACSTFLPAGRAVGEGVRGATLAPWIGAGRATAAAARLQILSLLSTAVACWACGLYAFCASRTLAGLLGLSGLAAGALAAVIALIARSRRVASLVRRLAQRVGITVGNEPPARPAPRAITAGAFALCLLGRFAQTLQYGAAVVAVGGPPRAKAAFVAQGIELVASTAGDLLPGQLGALEGIFSAFAETLGIDDAAARALSLVVLMRGALVAIALGGLVGTSRLRSS